MIVIDGCGIIWQVNGLIKEEVDILSRYIFIFIICFMLVLPYVQYLFFTADILLTTDQLNELNLNALKWLLYTFDALKILIVLNFILFVKYKKCGNVLVLFIGICMFLAWVHCALTQYSYRDNIIVFLNDYIFMNGIITSLIVIICQVILFLLYVIRQRNLLNKE